jgi:hypothetical protein
MRVHLATGATIMAVLSPCVVRAQSFYAGGGLGPTVVLDAPNESRSTYPNVYGVLGWASQGPLGARLEGAETYSRVWLSLDAVYRLGDLGSAIRPYAFAGPGVVIDLSRSDPLVNFGGGVWWNASPPLALFAECRFHELLSGASPGQSVLPITLGIAVGGR